MKIFIASDHAAFNEKNILVEYLKKKYEVIDLGPSSSASTNYPEWVKETGVKLIAISIDDAKTSGKVVTDVKLKGWEYEIYIDENQDFKRAMNVNNVPHTFIINGKGEIVWSHNSYSDGDEDVLYENIKALIKGEKLKH